MTLRQNNLTLGTYCEPFLDDQSTSADHGNAGADSGRET